MQTFLVTFTIQKEIQAKSDQIALALVDKLKEDLEAKDFGVILSEFRDVGEE